MFEFAQLYTFVWQKNFDIPRSCIIILSKAYAWNKLQLYLSLPSLHHYRNAETANVTSRDVM